MKPDLPASVTRTGSLGRILAVLGCLYLFLVGVSGMGEAFKLFGREFAERTLGLTSNPVTGLFLGVLATALVQSSSTSTSIVVGMVAGGAVALPGAVAMIMGANIGTTITAFMVALAYLKRSREFEHAYGAALLHLLFNMVAVALLFPLELTTGLVSWLAQGGAEAFAQMGGMRLTNPLQTATQPAIQLLRWLLFDQPLALLVATVLLTFATLLGMVRLLRSLVLRRVEGFFDRHLFRNWGRAMLFGFLLTVAVQSSSIPTTLAIPLAAAGVLKLSQVYPYNLGANVGTTVTAMLAALATGHPTAIVVAFAHLCFNLLGIVIIWGWPPLRRLPLALAERMVRWSSGRRWLPPTIFLAVYFLVPLAVVIPAL